jgi:hypothetical protein
MPAKATSLVLHVVQVPHWTQSSRLSYPETQDDSPLFGVPSRVPGVLEEA